MIPDGPHKNFDIESSLASAHLERRHFLKLNLATLTALSMPAISANANGQVIDTQNPEVWRRDPGASPQAELERILIDYSVRLPDTEWRRNWNKSYEAKQGVDDRLKALVSEYENKNPAMSDEQVREFEDTLSKKLYSEWKREYSSLESGGERVFDGTQVSKDLTFTWFFMDCKTYCFDLLRRDFEKKEIFDSGIPGQIGELINRGYFPVKNPQDFDIVMYGDIKQFAYGKDIDAGHWGMCKDGKIISKDILSPHVYKHAVEESAAYSSHYMYFRHVTQPDPSTLPQPGGLEGYEFVYRDSVACLEKGSFSFMPVGSKRIGVALGGGALYLALRVYMNRHCKQKVNDIPHEESLED